jgi:hypothetical protein
MDAWRLKSEPWRLKIEPWMVYRPGAQIPIPLMRSRIQASLLVKTKRV